MACCQTALSQNLNQYWLFFNWTPHSIILNFSHTSHQPVEVVDVHGQVDPQPSVRVHGCPPIVQVHGCPPIVQVHGCPPIVQVHSCPPIVQGHGCPQTSFAVADHTCVVSCDGQLSGCVRRIPVKTIPNQSSCAATMYYLNKPLWLIWSPGTIWDALQT